MDMIKIEKKIPVNPQIRRGKWMSLIKKMATGDSVLVTRNESIALFLALKRMGFYGVMRKQENGKYRVWKFKGKK